MFYVLKVEYNYSLLINLFKILSTTETISIAANAPTRKVLIENLGIWDILWILKVPVSKSAKNIIAKATEEKAAFPAVTKTH